MMKLQDVDFLQLVPLFMREDDTVQGLAEGSGEVTKALTRKMRLLSRWDQIDNMNHADLDEFAWELNILWYDSTNSLEAKRKIIKESDRVYDTLGTKWAVEQMLSAFFGQIRVREWFEYGGQPHHFKIFAMDPDLMGARQEKFLYLLDIAKRKSQWLESVQIGISGDLPIYVGMAAAGLTKEVHRIGTQVKYVNTMKVFGAMAVAGLNHEKVRMGTNVKFVAAIGLSSGVAVRSMAHETVHIIAQ